MSKNAGISLAVASFEKDAEGIIALVSDIKVEDILKSHVARQCLERYEVTKHDLNITIELMKRRLDSLLKKQPAISYEHAIEQVIKDSVYNDEKFAIFEALTEKKAGNIEIALETRGKYFNISDLKEGLPIEETTKTVKNSLESVLRKTNLYLPMHVSQNAIDIYYAECPIIPSSIVNEIFRRILEDYFSANYEQANDGNVKLKNWVKKEEPLLVEEATTKPQISPLRRFWEHYKAPLTATAIVMALAGAVTVAALKHSGSNSGRNTEKKIFTDNYEATFTPKKMVIAPYKREGIVLQFGYNQEMPTEEEIGEFKDTLKGILNDAQRHFKDEYGKDPFNFKKNISLTLEWDSTASPDGDYDHNRDLAKGRELSTDKIVYAVLKEFGFDEKQIKIKRSSTPEKISDKDSKLLEKRAEELGMNLEDYIGKHNELGQLTFGSDPSECEFCQEILAKYRTSFINLTEIGL